MATLNFYNKLHQLPAHIQKEVNDFIEFLSLKYLKSSSSKKENVKKNFSFDWEGSLKSTKTSSVELQHKANEWRNS